MKLAASQFLSRVAIIALLGSSAIADADDMQPRSMLDLLPAVLDMAADPPPEFKLSTLCQVHVVPEDGEEQGYYSILSIDARRAFVVAFSRHKLERPWETMTFRGQLVPTGERSPIDEGTADWAYIYDRNGDGNIDFLAYLVGPLWMLPEGAKSENLPKVKDGVMVDFFQANQDMLGQGFWFLADDNFDGRDDGLIARTVNKKTGWTDGWVVVRDTDFDQRYDSCISTVGDLGNPPKPCRESGNGYEVRGHSVAGLKQIPPPPGFPLESFNEVLEACKMQAEQLYNQPYPAWTEYDPVTVDFESQADAVTQEACHTNKDFESCHFLAQNDDAAAQVTLGSMYAQGRGVARDVTASVSWFRKAAQLGEADGQAKLGAAYTLGEGVEQDSAEAAQWYRRAAEQNHAAAQYMLARAYDKGDGIEMDENEALALYRKSAELGYADAQFMLGLMSDTGRGVPQDHAAAAEWYSKAAEQGSAVAQYNLAFCYWKGEGVAKDQAEALRCFHDSAEQGFGPAQEQLALRYLYGVGVDENVEEGIKWLQQAARSGVANAQAQLGLRFMTGGGGVPENVIYGYAWLLVAEHNGYPKATEFRKSAKSLLTRKQRAQAEQLAQEMLGSPEP